MPGFGRWTAYGRVGRSETLDGIEVRYPPLPLPAPAACSFTHAWRFYLAGLERAVRTPARPGSRSTLPIPDGMAAVEYGRRVGCPVVISVHGHDVREIPQANRRWRARWSPGPLARAAAVIVSSEGREETAECAPSGSRKSGYTPSPQGVDCGLFKIGRRQAPQGESPGGSCTLDAMTPARDWTCC